VPLQVSFGGRPSEHVSVSLDEKMKAKYCPCFGVNFGAVGGDDIGEDFRWLLSDHEVPMRVDYRLQRVKSIVGIDYRLTPNFAIRPLAGNLKN
jgi:hypothetical protein